MKNHITKEVIGKFFNGYKFVDNLGTCRTFLRSMVGFTYISPQPAAIIMFPSLVEIFYY